MLSDAQYRRIHHRGLRSDRNEHSVFERCFSELWEKENKREPGINGGLLF